jgi:hypothetical protein
MSARPCRGYTVSGARCGNVTNNPDGLCGRCAGEQPPGRTSGALPALRQQAEVAAQPPPIPVRSRSRAGDAGLVALADVGGALRQAGVFDAHRVIGGHMVSGHIWRLGARLPLRETADADLGFTPFALRNASLVPAIEALGYVKVHGNTWQRDLGDDVVASVGLLVAAATSRHRSNRRIGDVVTAEVPGLGVALIRPGVPLRIDGELTTGHHVTVDVLTADTLSAVGLKAHAWNVRHKDNDAEDLWRCLELAYVEGAQRPDGGRHDPIRDVAPVLERSFTGRGSGLDAATRQLSRQGAAERKARIEALVRHYLR